MIIWQFWKLVAGRALQDWWAWVWDNIFAGLLVSGLLLAATWGIRHFVLSEWSLVPRAKEEPMISLSDFVWGSAAIACVLFAVFVFFLVFVTPPKIHSEQLESLEAARKELKDAVEQIKARDQVIADREPNFTGNIYGVTSTDQVVPDGLELGRGTLVILKISIRNNGGAASATENWKVHATLPSGEKLDGIIIALAKPFVVNIPADTLITSVTFTNDDLIAEKTFKPVEPGDIVRGVLTIYFKNTSNQQMSAIGTSYEVRFSDVNRKSYTIEAKNTGEPMLFGGRHWKPGEPWPVTKEQRQPGSSNE